MVHKVFFLLSFFILFGFAQKIEITSLKMEANDLKKEIRFDGNVKIKEGVSKLDSQEAIVYLDEHNKAKEYRAIGNVVFYIKKEGNEYNGKAGEVRYFPQSNTYYLKNDAEVEDLINKRVLTGNKMVLDMNKKQARVDGKKDQPIEFIFETKGQ